MEKKSLVGRSVSRKRPGGLMVSPGNLAYLLTQVVEDEPRHRQIDRLTDTQTTHLNNFLHHVVEDEQTETDRQTDRHTDYPPQ